MTTLVADEPLTPLGYEQISSMAAAVGLTVPDGATYARIQATTQSVRWRDDGTSPTATVGMRLRADAEADLWYQGELRQIEFIEEAASAELNVSYYR